MAINAVQARNILGELDHRMGLFHYAEDRASFWHELFFVQSIEEYLLFLWLEADAEELQGNAALSQVDLGTKEQVCDARQAALVHYAQAAVFRSGIVSLLQLDYRPFLPAWIDALGDRWHGPEVPPDGEAIYPNMDDQILERFANREMVQGNVIIYQLRHLNDPSQSEQALQHYKAAALAYRRLIGGWLLQYAVGMPRVIMDEIDLADLNRLKRQLQEVQATIARLAPQAHDPYVDEVDRFFHLGMVGSGRLTRRLNERKMVALDWTINVANKLTPFYKERERILERIADIWSGRNQRQRRHGYAKHNYACRAPKKAITCWMLPLAWCVL